ncbi:MAG: AAA family ATPase [Muribaculaceae bacterium]|nr:AAA family ATPase [Muribaculaceae bacterium]
MRLFISDNCWDEIIDLPKKIQARVKDFQRKFKENPYSHNINLEKITQFKDQSLRTARINDEYRAIIGVLPGDEFCLLHIDHHDEAMNWAKNKKFIWNEYVGSFQIVPVVEASGISENSEPQETDATECGLFYHITDEQLRQIGVPQESLSIVYGIKDLNDLDAKQSMLPEDVFERLFYLSDGDMTISEIIADIEAGKADERECANNKRRFVEISGDNDLEEIIDGDIQKWQIFLHPSQRMLVDSNFKGTVKVSGGGGTGKTVAALHRLKRLSDNATNKSVLFTSYTTTLIDNIRERLTPLGVNMADVVVNNIDAVAIELGKQFGILDRLSVNLDFDAVKAVWRRVAEDNLSEFSADFLATEYADIIAFNNIKSEADYRKVSRIGRGKPISPKQRKAIWSMVEDFRKRRGDAGIIDRSDLFNLLADYLNENQIRPFKHVIADEIQDFSNPELRFLRSLVEEGPNDLFLVGDPFQRIYNTKGINFTVTGINVRGKRSRRLKINYRTTEEIKRAATALVKGIEYDDFDGEQESLKGYLSLMHGQRPEYKTFASREEEISFVIANINDCVKSGMNYNDIVLGCQFKDALRTYQTALHEQGIPYRNINGTGTKDGVVLSTLHRMKGLEFKVVIIADVNDRTFNYVPQTIDQTDILVMRSLEQSRRSLMYVAITRAMQRVLITGIGTKPSSMQNL